MEEMIKSEEEWKKILAPEQFDILRKKGIELTFSDNFWDNEEKGEYYCAACDNLLFLSDDKYDSMTGWPSFTKPAAESNVQYNGTDYNLGIEIICARCRGHLGHVFNDAPKDISPEGRRFCINGKILRFEKK